MEAHAYTDDERRALQPWFDATVPLPPTPGRVATRVRGMLLGLALGDSLGNTSEGMTPAERRDVYGTPYGDELGDLRDYLPNRREDGLVVGLPSDDTQLAFWTVESLLRRRGFDPVDLADTFTRQHRIYGIGSTVTAFLLAYRFGGKRWWEAGKPSAGNGALMRIAPVVLPYLRGVDAGLWQTTVAATALTHRDEAAVAASAGFVGLLLETLALPSGSIPKPEWWPRTFLTYARALETGVQYGCRVPNDGFRGTLCDRVEQTVLPALAAGVAVEEAAGGWFSGAYLLETVPCALLALALHAGDAEEAIVRAVNDTYDNDTVAAIVGATVGALHGEGSLPRRWRDGLLGRTREADDGRVQALLDEAVEVFA
jgi:ADP-ribosyl-[dinitrogen reductase] hydrolase